MHIRVFKIVGGSSFVLGLGLTDLAERRISGMDEYVKAALSGSVVGAVTGAAEMIPVGRLARAGVDFGAGAMGSAGSQMILDGKVELETMFHEGALAAVMAMVGRRLRGGGEGGVGKGSVEGMDDGSRVIEGGSGSRKYYTDYDEWLKSLTPDEINAIKIYTGNDYKMLNQYLRGQIDQLPSHLNQDVIDNINKALNKMQTVSHVLYTEEQG